VLKHCSANPKRRLSALPNVGPYIKFMTLQGAPYIYDLRFQALQGGPSIYDINISEFTRSSIEYIYI
jgi:hypothetical protein